MKSDSAARRRRASIRAMLLAPLAFAVGGLGATQAAAQGGHRVSVGGAPTTSSTTITPRSAGAGETVWIQTAYLPPGTAVQFMLGALRDGFEVVDTRVTDETGKIAGVDSLQMKVPHWVTWDRPYLMIVTDIDYNPLGMADMFHPTDGAGRLLRTGTVQRELTGGCPSLTGESDEIYFLTGNTSALRAGDRVRIVARALDSDQCGNGTTLEVLEIQRMPQPKPLAPASP